MFGIDIYQNFIDILSTDQRIFWEHNDVLNSSIDCVQQGKDIHFHSQSGICWG